MNITSRIKAHRDAINANPGGGTARRIRRQSVEAILNGRRSSEWRTYMENFSSNGGQLNRLLGEDTVFMNHPDGWGPLILAYIAGSGPCGGGTELGMADDMPTGMKNHLDRGVEGFVPSESIPLSDELKLFLEDELPQITSGSDDGDQTEVKTETESSTE